MHCRRATSDIPHLGRWLNGRFQITDPRYPPSRGEIATGSFRPDPVVHDHQIERLLPPEAAMPVLSV